MTPPSSLKQIQRLLIGHGALLIFVAGAIGFGFLFFLNGEISLWPIPGRIAVKLPGSIKAWRMAHLEGVINGLILWLVALLLPILPFALAGARRIATGMIVVGWTFTVASLFDALFPESRGLAYGGPLTNQIAFFMFYIGVLIVMGVMASIAWRTLVATRNTELG
ncbi:hypothetical protein [Nevskia soli]|uniref:hypothetical protein n=1 Tax=Nevskia soli TaxID=418856 RepID=UPI00068DFB9E|nr:hypothetical protein [Nevskia soli]